MCQILKAETETTSTNVVYPEQSLNETEISMHKLKEMQLQKIFLLRSFPELT